MRWLPIVCVLVLIFAVAFVASRNPPHAQASGVAAIRYDAATSAPASEAAGGVQVEPLVPATVASPWLRPLVGVAPPVPVVEGQGSDAVELVLPAVPVAATVEAPPLPPQAVIEPAVTPPPAVANSTLSSDTAPTTAREDALLRSWPYPPLPEPATPSARRIEDATAPALAPPAGAVLGDPNGTDTAERAALWATPLSGTPNDPAAKEQKDPLAGWGPPPAPAIDPRRFTEAHWQGIEVIPNTPLVAQALRIPADAPGVIIDDVTLPADLQGFVAGDLVTHVGGVPTPDLTSFIDATDQVRDQPRAIVQILRDGQPARMQLAALKERLGTANGETASMIPPGARMPHPYRGPCTNCHRIGTTGTLAVDQGDMMTTGAPAIRADAKRPHRDRGPCRACHQILP